MKWLSYYLRIISAQDSNPHGHYQEENQDEDLELPTFGLATIFAATDQFALSNKIGQGGFGPVYKVWQIFPSRVVISLRKTNPSA